MKNILLSLFIIGFLFCSCKEEVKEDLLTKAWEEINNKNYQQAEEYCNQILASSDTLHVDSLREIYLARHSARVMLDKWQLCLEDCQKMIELGDTSIDTKNMLGQAHSFLGNYDDAIQVYQKLANIDSEKFEPYFQIGDAYRMKREVDSAYKYFTMSIENKPLKNALAYNRRGRLYSEDKLYKKAIVDFDSAISQLEGSEHQCLAYTLRGEVYYQLEEIDKALRDFDNSIELCQDLVSPYYHRGFIYAQQNQKNEALENYKKAVDLDSTRLDIYWNMSRIYKKLGNKQELIYCYSAILKQEPANYSALELRGFIYSHLGDYESAIKDFDKIINADIEETDKDQTYELRGIVYLRLDKDEQACNDFHKAVSLGNKEAQRRINLVCK
ncbi:tetratricopeptide repeat protein [Bernardetia sp. ABR2-2B]|uniref:tetratricopeptide repeat protein n=1 Tax=Bernardetia sp. ABR2-2B TaxID=3127472 RepID=UPI0030CBB9EF